MKQHPHNTLLPYHIELLSAKVGEDVTTPAGATRLRFEIWSKVGMLFGVNTIKRLVGVLPSDSEPRRTTLNAIANYLGYVDWNLLMFDTNNKHSSGFRTSRPVVDMTKVSSGAEVEICWKPNRRIVIRHDGNGQYTVKISENCKLQPGDLLSIWELRLGTPFIADKVFRNEQPLGCYTAADGAGIMLFNVLSGYVS